MASERFDYIAVSPRGVYALCEDTAGARRDVREFIADTLRAGHHIERVTVAEAVRRHLEYLASTRPKNTGAPDA